MLHLISCCCYTISEFVALKYARFRVQKLIENAKKTVWGPVNDVLFSKSTQIHNCGECCLSSDDKLSGYSRIFCFKIGYISGKKSIGNAKKRVLTL